jgi:PiT family inorganic phosphate transporter
VSRLGDQDEQSVNHLRPAFPGWISRVGGPDDCSVTEALLILVVVIVTALAFDFTNGFHDTGNAMATSIATGALQPKVAVALSAVLNLVGAFLSIEVALTVSNKVVSIQDSSGAPIEGLMGTPILTIVFAGLVGGILWNLTTWLLGLPSSSSHALFGGLIGSAIAALGLGGVKWDGVITSIIVPAFFAPLVAGLVAGVGTWMVYRIVARIPERRRDAGFRWGQIGSASLVSLAHGTNDAQKTMGVITLALIAYGSWTQTDAIPFWVKAACAVAIAAGTYVGGWRVIRTLGKGLVEIHSPQGMAAETASAAIILSSSHLGMALSTTHVATGSILGSGVGKRGADVRWRVAGRMVVAWITTLPAAGLIGALCWFLADGIGGAAGIAIVFAILVGAATWMFLRSGRTAINPDNVNAEWQGGLAVTDTATSAAQPVAVGTSTERN